MRFTTLYRIPVTLLLLTFVTLNEADRESILWPIGDLYFTDTHHTLTFDLNIDSYYSNAKLLSLNAKKLDEKCNLKNNSLLFDCIYFRDNVRNISDLAIKEMSYIKTNVKSNRKKRELICMAITMLGIAITTTIAGFFAGMAIAAETQKNLINQSNIQHNITSKQFNIDEKIIDISNKSTNVFLTNLHQLTESQYINQLLFSTLLAINKHHKDTDKFFSLLNDDIQSKFFDIIDIVTFLETIKNMKEKEIKNSAIFSLKPHEIVKLSASDVKLLNNTIQLNIYIPLTTGEKFKLYNFIPIPIKKDGNTFILNMDSKYIIRNKSIFMEMPIATLVKCTQASKISICDELLHDKLSPLDDCINATMNNEITKALCIYNRLPNKNQIIKISSDSLYVYITERMTFKILCGNNAKVYNLTQSSEVNYGKHCKLSTKVNFFNKNETSTVVKIDSNFIEPNFSVFINSTWEKAEFLNQHNIQTQNLIYEIKDASNYFNENSKIINMPDNDFLSILPNFIFNEMIQFILLYIALPIIVIIFITCCLCRYTK